MEIVEKHWLFRVFWPHFTQNLQTKNMLNVAKKPQFAIFAKTQNFHYCFNRIRDLNILWEFTNCKTFEELRKIWSSGTQIMLILHKISKGNFTRKMSENHRSRKNFQIILKKISLRGGLGISQINMFLTSESTFKRFCRRRYILSRISLSRWYWSI